MSVCLVVATLVASAGELHAHNGPPFPVMTDRAAGSYVVSLWADPDASDDGSADGRFWVLVNPATKGVALPGDTVVQVSIWPVEHPEAVRSQTATADEHEPTRRTAAFVIDHEGKYRVKAAIAGSLGPADVETDVDAEYDARPRPILIGVFALPFVLIGYVWLKLLIRRRADKKRAGIRG